MNSTLRSGQFKYHDKQRTVYLKGYYSNQKGQTKTNNWKKSIEIIRKVAPSKMNNNNNMIIKILHTQDMRS